MKRTSSFLPLLFLAVLGGIFLYPADGWAPNIGSRLTSTEKFENFLFSLFTMSGPVLAYYNLRLGRDFSWKKAIPFNGLVYILGAGFSLLLAPSGLQKNGFWIAHMTIYFSVINWLLLCWWLLAQKLDLAPFCHRVVDSPLVLVGSIGFVLLATSPVLMFPFYLVSLFL